MQRRSHRKSRFGCKRCKMRRMKCDEVHPACGNCVRHAVPCDFTQIRNPESPGNLEPVLIPALVRLDREAPSRNTTPTTSGFVSSPSSHSALVLASKSGLSTYSTSSATSIQRNQHPIVYQLPYPTPVGTPSNRLFELKLFHHYMQMSHASMQLPQNDPPRLALQSIWKQWIAGLAMKDDTLMDALLGFAATNLRVLCPSDRKVANASYHYMLRAITSHAKQVREGINAQNAEVLFATSTFMALSSTMTPTDEARGPPLHWFRPYQGTRAIAEAAGWDGFQNTKIQQQLKDDLDNVESFIISQKMGQQLQFDFLLDDLRLDDNDADTISAYQRAVAYLNMMGQTPIPRDILRFPAMVSRRFMDLMAAEDPRTLTIVGYFFMLVRKVGGLWWIRGQAVAEFKALMELIPEEWQSKMSWAVRVFEQEEIGPSQSS